MKNIVIINFTRMGDIIQSTSLFKKIKLVYPDSFVRLLISEEFSGIAPFICDVDEVRFIDIRGLSEILKAENFSFTSELYEKLIFMIEGITPVHYDIAVNLSHDEFGMYFLYMLGAKKTVGLSVTREMQTVSTDKMITYFFAAVKNRKTSVLNIVDIYERCLSGGAHVNKICLDTDNDEGKKAIAGADDILKEAGVGDKDIVISFAIGASSSFKKWHNIYFAALARLLLDYDERIKVVLLGAGYDMESGDYIEKKVSDKRLINLTGKTSVAKLVGIVKRTGLLITHDTGTMHIGVALGVKLIVLYTGNVGFYETGPYSINQVLVIPDINCFPCDFGVKCLNQLCKNLIKPEYIFDIAKFCLEKSVLDKNGFSKFKNSGIIPMISRFDSKRFIDYLPAVQGRMTSTALRLRIAKLAFEYSLEKDYGEIADEELNLFIDCFNEIDNNAFIEINDELSVIDKMVKLCEKGMEDSKLLIKTVLNNPLEVKSISKMIADGSIDIVLNHLASVYDELSLIDTMHIATRQSSLSYDPFGFAIDLLKSYSNYKNQLKIFKKIGLKFLEKIRLNYNYNNAEGSNEAICR